MKKIVQEFLHINLDKINSDRAFRDVSALVDKDEFLSDLIEFRNQYLDGKVIPYEEVSSWNFKELPMEQRGNTSEKTALIFLPAIEHIEISRNMPPTKAVQNLRFFVTKLLQKYSRPAMYDEIVKAAVLSGFVTQNEIKELCYPIFTEKPMVFSGLGHVSLPIPHAAAYIALSPLTTPEEATKVCKNAIDQLRSMYHAKAHRAGSVRRDREWYWRKKNGESDQQIANSESNAGQPISRNAVFEAVDAYSKLLL